MNMRGQCSCGQIQFQVHAPPMIVHCCHCTWCQRETGSAFVINAVVETDRVELASGKTEQQEEAAKHETKGSDLEK